MKTKNKKLERILLLTAGPANISERVRKSLAHYDICHRDREFADLLCGVRKKAVNVAGGSKDYTSVVFVNSGTGAIESVMGSAIETGKNTLIIVNGNYGERIRKIAQVLELPYRDLEYAYDKVPDLNAVESVLKNDKNMGYVAMVHMETTLGKLNPMHDVGMLCRKYGKKYIVDAMASFGAEPLNVIKDNIDYCIANSNKGLQGPPGLSLVVAKKSDLEKLKKKKPKSLYLDLYNQYRVEEEKGQTPYTPAIQTLFGLNEALDELLEEGVANRQKRYRASSDALVDGLMRAGFCPVLAQNIRSRTLTTFENPSGMPYEELHDALKKEGYEIYPGKGPNAEKTFRIGNLGIVNYNHIQKFLKTFEGVVKNAGHK